MSNDTIENTKKNTSGSNEKNWVNKDFQEGEKRELQGQTNKTRQWYAFTDRLAKLEIFLLSKFITNPDI